MNKTASASATIYVIVMILLTGFLLFNFNDPINEFRADALANASNSNVIEKMLLFALMPIIWGGYLFFSFLGIRLALGGGLGGFGL